MTFQKSIEVCFSKYFTFSGRASRSEFWWFYSLTYLIEILVSAISPMGGFVISAAFMIPTFSAGSRRLHDIGKTGWWQAVPAIPCLVIIIKSINGFMDVEVNKLNQEELLSSLILWCLFFVLLEITLLIFFASPSQKGSNKYGNDSYDVEDPINISNKKNIDISIKNNDDDFEKLERLYQMQKNGILSEEEFKILKNQILNKL
jgi:hypothetical protein